MTASRAIGYSLGDAMDSAVPHRLHTETPSRPSVTAGADEPEGVAVERVAAHPAAGDAGLAADDVSRVKCPQCELPFGHDGPHSITFTIPASSDWTGSPEQVAEWNRKVRDGTAVRWLTPEESSEHERKARLRRWQAVGRDD